MSADDSHNPVRRLLCALNDSTEAVVLQSFPLRLSDLSEPAANGREKQKKEFEPGASLKVHSAALHVHE